MDSRLIQLLCDAYPKLFAATERWEIDDGWFLLLWTMGKQIPEPLQTTVFVVKEKFGELRLQGMSIPQEVLDQQGVSFQQAMDYYHYWEQASHRVCERCGRFGESRGSGWTMTLCDPCWADRRKERGIR